MRLEKTLVIFAFIFIACSSKKDTSNIGNLRTLNLNYDGVIPIDKKVELKLIEFNGAEEIIHNGYIKRRGGYSILFPKHSYNVDFNVDKPLANLPSDDDWILNANYIDKTFLRHVFSYELFSDMDPNNLSSKCQYVEVRLNGSYNGLYVLMERLDKSSLKVNDADSLAFIFKEPHLFRSTYEGVVPQDSSNFHQQILPKIQNKNMEEYLENARRFILESSDEIFSNQFDKVFDIRNIIDWHLLLLVSNNNDGILKNFYLYKSNNETPIRIAPWDYDHSFGRDGDNELNMDERFLNINRSILFSRLLGFDWYTKALKDRWQELNNSALLSESGLKQRVIRMSESISHVAEKNFELWPVDNDIYYDDNDFNQEVNIMIKYIEKRHKRLLKYFDEI